MSFLLGKTAIVTGGSGTIGMAIAGALVRQGAHVLLIGRSPERLARARRTLERTTTGGDVACLSCDVTSETSVVALFDRVRSDYGGCDLLVNNAGTMGVVPGRRTTDLSRREFDHVLHVNVTGPFLCSREALKQMSSRSDDGGGGGRIINIGSVSAQSPRPDSAPYTTSKFALQGLTQSLALDAREHNVSVGIIHPGNVRSNLLSPEEIERRQQSEGFMEPEDVANCVVTMASLPYTTSILEMTVIPTIQPLVGRG